MLGFLDTPRNSVNLTVLGIQLLDADMSARKIILNQQLHTLNTFKFILKLIEDSPIKRLTRDLVLEELAMLLPTEDVEKLFDTIVTWGRFAELFTYSTDTESLTLDVESMDPPA
jgi:NitT/TauT family transport system ATP-binding protein